MPLACRRVTQRLDAHTTCGYARGAQLIGCVLRTADKCEGEATALDAHHDKFINSLCPQHTSLNLHPLTVASTGMVPSGNGGSGTPGVMGGTGGPTRPSTMMAMSVWLGGGHSAINLLCTKSAYGLRTRGGGGGWRGGVTSVGRKARSTHGHTHPLAHSLHGFVGDEDVHRAAARWHGWVQ